jgi:hypothetical protein
MAFTSFPDLISGSNKNYPQLQEACFWPRSAALIIAAAQPTPLSTRIALAGQFN